MKYTYTLTVESESLEEDLNKVVNTVMGAVERYLRVSKETESDKDTATDELEDKVNDLSNTVHGLDNRIDGLEAKIDSFCEVDISKRVKPSK